MCVIILQEAHGYLEKDEAEAAWEKNPDGGGYSFINQDGELETKKFMKFDPMWKAFEKDRSANRKSPFLTHFRIATHGSVCIDNVHPFQVDEHTVMAHNGIINRFHKDPTGQDRSDTRMYIDEVLNDFGPLWLDNENIRELVEKDIGWSKLVFLSTNPLLKRYYYILNERSGTWDDKAKLWMSNTNHRYYPSSKKVTTYSSLPKPQPGYYDDEDDMYLADWGYTKNADGSWTSDKTPARLFSGDDDDTPVEAFDDDDSLLAPFRIFNQRNKPIGIRFPFELLHHDDERILDSIVQQFTMLDTKSFDDLDEDDVANFIEVWIERDEANMFKRFAMQQVENTFFYTCYGCNSFIDQEEDGSVLCECSNYICAKCSKYADMCDCNGEFGSSALVNVALCMDNVIARANAHAAANAYVYSDARVYD